MNDANDTDPRKLHPLMRKPSYDPYAELDEPPQPRTPFAQVVAQTPVTWVLLLANVAAFVVGVVVPGLDRQLLAWGANQGYAVWQEGEVWRLLTSIFLHGGIAHIAFNMLSLYNVGASMERVYGRQRYLTIYFGSGLGGAVLGALLNDPWVLSVGASGAILGLIGADIAVMLRIRHLAPEYAGARLRGSALTIGLLLLIGFLPGSIIDNWGHIGGLLAGVGLGWSFMRGELGQRLEQTVRRGAGEDSSEA